MIRLEFKQNRKTFSKLKKEKLYMTSEVILYLMKNVCLYNVSIILSFDTIRQKINRRKSGFLDKKVIICDLEWFLRSHFILWKICVFSIIWFINKCSRNKKDDIFVRYRRTFVLNKCRISIHKFILFLSIFDQICV